MHLLKDASGQVTTGDVEADERLYRAIDNARVLAREVDGRVYVYWHAEFGLSVHQRKPWRPYLEVLPNGRTTFHARPVNGARMHLR